MAAAVCLREDYDAAGLRELAKRSADAAQTRRLLALAAIYAGGSRTEAAQIGGVGLQTVRDWVLAFNTEGPAGLVNGKAPGNAPLLNNERRDALRQIVESDAEGLHAAYGDAEAMRFWNFPATRTVAETAALIKRAWADRPAR